MPADKGLQLRRRARVAVVVALAHCAALPLGCASRPERSPVAARPGLPRVSVMTFNVNFALADDGRTVNAVADDASDVIFLQETTPAWEETLRSRLSASHPHMAFLHHPGAGGLAVLSRSPLKRVEYLPEENWFPAARVVVETRFGPLQVLNVHLRPPIGDDGGVVSGYFRTPPVRRREIETFAAALDPHLPTLIVGDFNEHEGGRALRWLRGRGMRSALPEFSPYARTWRWQTSVIKLGGRYDHIVYDARLEPLSVTVRRTGRSDHLPVVGVFALAEPPADPSPPERRRRYGRPSSAAARHNAPQSATSATAILQIEPVCRYGSRDGLTFIQTGLAAAVPTE